MQKISSTSRSRCHVDINWKRKAHFLKLNIFDPKKGIIRLTNLEELIDATWNSELSRLHRHHMFLHWCFYKHSQAVMAIHLASAS